MRSKGNSETIRGILLWWPFPVQIESGLKIGVSVVQTRPRVPIISKLKMAGRLQCWPFFVLGRWLCGGGRSFLRLSGIETKLFARQLFIGNITATSQSHGNNNMKLFSSSTSWVKGATVMGTSNRINVPDTPISLKYMLPGQICRTGSNREVSQSTAIS